MKKTKLGSIIFLLLIFFVVIGLNSCNASTLKVGSGKMYLKIQDAIDNSSAGDTIHVDSGTYNEKIIIEKELTLTGENKENTIIDHTSSYNVIIIKADNVKISGFTIQDSISWDYSGIKIENAENCIIENNIFFSNEGNGIYLKKSHENLITRNDFNNNYYALKLEDSENNSIIDNDFNYNWFSIFLKDSLNNIISNNELKDSKSISINLNTAKNNIINNNNLIDNPQGMKFDDYSNNNKVYNNNIENSKYNGIVTQIESKMNTFYHNNFINNTNHATVDLHRNYWYNSTLKEGNYWDDYQGTDDNNDGIGDQQYQIGEGVNTYYDLYPLMEPLTINNDGNVGNNNDILDNGNDNQNEDNKGSPGFELTLIVIAIASIVIVINRKKILK